MFVNRLFGLLSLLIVGTWVQAVEVDYLYIVNVPVLSQSTTERSEAFRQGMKTVLVRVSGNREITAHPDTELILKQASQYVREYKYTSLDKVAPATVLEFKHAERVASMKNADRVTPAQVLHIVFDGRALEKRLNEKNMPVWGQDRPAILVWLAVQESKRSFILGESDQHLFKELTEKSAINRGIPLIFPIQDLEDQRNLKVADIRMGFTDAIQKASARYGADMILVGMLTQRGADLWSTDWSVYRQNTSSGWQLESNASETISKSIDNAADILATRYAMSGSRDATRTSVPVYIENVKNINDYASVQNYIASLTPVDSVNPRMIGSDTVYFEVVMRGGRSDLERAIALQTLLKAVTDTALSALTNTAVAEPLPLRYQLSSGRRER